MENKEKRYINGSVEIRKDSEGKESRIVEGYALLFNTDSRDLGGFIEQVSPNALKGADMTEVIARTDHDSGRLLARTESKTLTLEIDERGLKYSFEAPNTTAGNDLLEYLKRGDISGSSFAFNVKSDTWIEPEKEGEPARRTINEIGKLFDVSPVVTPAYPDTTVAKRSLEEITSKEGKKTQSKRKGLTVSRTLAYLKLKNKHTK